MMEIGGTAVNESAAGVPPTAERRSQTVSGKLRRGQHEIEQEIERNHGKYPFNSGWLTEAEVCRRAGIAPRILHESAEAASVRVELEAWLRKTSTLATAAARGPSIQAADVAAALKAQLEEIAVGYQQANLEVAALRKRFQELEERERMLVETYAKLDAELARRGATTPEPASPSH